MNTENQLSKLVQENVSSLYSVATVISALESWPKEARPAEDIAATIFDLFEALTWSDRSLHNNEYKLFEAVLEEDKLHGSHVAALVGSRPHNSSLDQHTSICLSVAARHDSTFGTTYQELLVNHLKNLGLLILMADKRIEPAEIAAFDTYFKRLLGQVETVSNSS